VAGGRRLDAQLIFVKATALVLEAHRERDRTKVVGEARERQIGDEAIALARECQRLRGADGTLGALAMALALTTSTATGLRRADSEPGVYGVGPDIGPMVRGEEPVTTPAGSSLACQGSAMALVATVDGAASAWP
jgi:hypothetical protein